MLLVSYTSFALHGIQNFWRKLTDTEVMEKIFKIREYYSQLPK